MDLEDGVALAPSFNCRGGLKLATNEREHMRVPPFAGEKERVRLSVFWRWRADVGSPSPEAGEMARAWSRLRAEEKAWSLPPSGAIEKVWNASLLGNHRKCGLRSILELERKHGIDLVMQQKRMRGLDFNLELQTKGGNASLLVFGRMCRLRPPRSWRGDVRLAPSRSRRRAHGPFRS